MMFRRLAKAYTARSSGIPDGRWQAVALDLVSLTGGGL
jgi:hypothetical protein